MKMNTRKFFAVLLAIVLLISLGACSKNGKESTGDVSSNSGSATEATEKEPVSSEKTSVDEETTPDEKDAENAKAEEKDVYSLSDKISFDGGVDYAAKAVHKLDDGSDKYLIIEYTITNNSDKAVKPLTTFVTQLFVDGAEIESDSSFDTRFIEDDPFASVEPGDTSNPLFATFKYTDGDLDFKLTYLGDSNPRKLQVKAGEITIVDE